MLPNPAEIVNHPGRQTSVFMAGAIAVLIMAQPARSQDAHYWAVQNGSQATLLGGAVVGLDTDLSAAYYNPGSLARVTDTGALSMFAKTVTDLTLTFETSPGLEAKSSVGASAPGMFAARIPGVHLIDDDIITFSYLVHQSSKLDMSGATLTSAVLPTEAVDVALFQDIYDGWYGLWWARDMNGFGVGVSLFFSSLSYRQRIETKDIVLDLGQGGALSENLYYSWSCRRLVAKGGVTWGDGPVSLGATVTAPSVRLPWSSGMMSVGRNYIQADTTLEAQVALSRQEDLDADYREPVSIAVGARARLGSFDFYASTEWFASVGKYDVLETRPLTSQVPPQQFELPITQERESVLNVGGGVSVDVLSWLSLFGSARTDRSYRNPQTRTFVGLGAYDLYHVTGGIGMHNDSIDVVLGGLFASGDSDGTYVTSPLPGAPSVPARTEFSEKGFMLAFSATF